VSDQQALYVHATREGAIYVVRLDLTSDFVTLAELDRLLVEARAGEALLLYSRDDPGEEPTPMQFEVFTRLPESRLPIKLLSDPHPAVAGGPTGGATRLMQFAYLGRADLVTDLAERGADLEVADDAGQTALMYASNAGHLDVVNALLHFAADPDTRDAQDSTALMYAAQGGFEGCVSALLAAGADAGARGSHGLTALGFAVQNHHDGTIARLRSAGAPE
jgi:ankyrin repeat protein